MSKLALRAFVAILIGLVSPQALADDSKKQPDAALYGKDIPRGIRLNIACPKDVSLPCRRVFRDISKIGPSAVGVTLVTSGVSAYKINDKLKSGTLKITDVRKHIKHTTVGLLPPSVEKAGAKTAVKVMKAPNVRNGSRAVALTGAVILSYAAYKYLFGEEPKE